MAGITKELDVLKQLFSRLSEEDKHQFLASVSQNNEIKRLFNPRKLLAALTSSPSISLKTARSAATSGFFSGLQEVVRRADRHNFIRLTKRYRNLGKIHTLYGREVSATQMR